MLADVYSDFDHYHSHDRHHDEYGCGCQRRRYHHQYPCQHAYHDDCAGAGADAAADRALGVDSEDDKATTETITSD